MNTGSDRRGLGRFGFCLMNIFPPRHELKTHLLSLALHSVDMAPIMLGLLCVPGHSPEGPGLPQTISI